MRVLICCIACLIATNSLAQEVSKTWTFTPNGKAIEFSPGFGNTCGCCSERSTLGQGAVSNSFGTTNSPPVFRKNVMQALKEMQPASRSVPPEVMHEIMAGAGTRAFIDLCNVCGCCTEHSDKVTVNPPAHSLSNEFQVFSK